MLLAPGIFTPLCNPINEAWFLRGEDVKQTHWNCTFYLLALATPPPTAAGRLATAAWSMRGQLSHDVIVLHVSSVL